MHFDGGMHPTDRGTQQPVGRRDEERTGLARPAEQLRTSADVHPEHETPVERPATRPARLDHDRDETDDSEDA
ncbi:DUF6104 family protein [uncultured Pseudokineococcus sp.]|uniref:DUF6104 family protein n=1 Tax=uncultured Pseudokineococcus sp. TaxID=1642928 RepID=UPI0026279B75|nr:DUF6104 family protein [uncultured Pseudokineococcus sp.]